MRLLHEPINQLKPAKEFNMCGASKIVKDHEDANDRQTLAIGKVDTHGGGKLGAFHRPGQATATCIMCVKSGTMLTIGNINAGLRNKFGLGVREIAKFVETPAWHDEDQLVFGNGKQVPLAAFANQGVTVFVGVKEDSDVDPINRVTAGGPAIKSHTGVLETHQDRPRVTA